MCVVEMVVSLVVLLFAVLVWAGVLGWALVVRVLLAPLILLL
jgi:hypothetical protein